MSKNGKNSKREEYLKECEGFGFDPEAGAGLDLTTATCKACVSNNPQRYDACRKEVEDAKTAATTATTAENGPDTPSKAETADEPVVATQKAKKVSKKTPKPKKEKVAKAPKTPKPPKVDKKPSVMHILVDILKEGGRSSSELTAELVTRTSCAKPSAGSHVAMAIRFGLIAGFVHRDESRKLELLNPHV